MRRIRINVMLLILIGICTCVSAQESIIRPCIHFKKMLIKTGFLTPIKTSSFLKSSASLKVDSTYEYKISSLHNYKLKLASREIYNYSPDSKLSYANNNYYKYSLNDSLYCYLKNRIYFDHDKRKTHVTWTANKSFYLSEYFGHVNFGSFFLSKYREVDSLIEFYFYENDYLKKKVDYGYNRSLGGIYDYDSDTIVLAMLDSVKHNYNSDNLISNVNNKIYFQDKNYGEAYINVLKLFYYDSESRLKLDFKSDESFYWRMNRYNYNFSSDTTIIIIKSAQLMTNSLGNNPKSYLESINTWNDVTKSIIVPSGAANTVEATRYGLLESEIFYPQLKLIAWYNSSNQLEHETIYTYPTPDRESFNFLNIQDNSWNEQHNAVDSLWFEQYHRHIEYNKYGDTLNIREEFWDERVDQWTTYREKIFYYSANTVDIKKASISQIKVYPNPANIFLTLTDASLLGNQYSITNVSGQIIQQGTISGQIIDISRLKCGVYILSVINDDEKYVTKFLKR